MTGFVAQMVVLSVLLVRKREGSWKQPLMLGAFLTMVIVFLLWMGNNELTRRLTSIHREAREEINGGFRLAIDRDCLRMLMKRPILGWGLGTFPVAYPEFRSFYTNFFVNQAHNDYLQLLVETGLAGFSIAVWFLVLVFRQAAGKLGDWTENASGALTVAALLGCVGILVHSALDFNLQIPANAALFYVLRAIAASKPLQESQRRRVLRRHSSSPESQADATAPAQLRRGKPARAAALHTTEPARRGSTVPACRRSIANNSSPRARWSRESRRSPGSCNPRLRVE